jgi:hypothetical protein
VENVIFVGEKLFKYNYPVEKNRAFPQVFHKKKFGKEKS